MLTFVRVYIKMIVLILDVITNVNNNRTKADIAIISIIGSGIDAVLSVEYLWQICTYQTTRRHIYKDSYLIRSNIVIVRPLL